MFSEKTLDFAFLNNVITTNIFGALRAKVYILHYEMATNISGNKKKDNYLLLTLLNSIGDITFECVCDSVFQRSLTKTR